MISRTLFTKGAIVATMAVSFASSAAVVSMDNFTGAWLNPTGSPFNFNTTNNPGNDPQAHWGLPLFPQGPQSGYLLDMAPPPPTPIVQNVPASSSFFIGKFTHENRPINENSITGIDLRIGFDIMIDATNLGTKFFDFHFAHDETPNNVDPCPYGGANGTGFNVSGCADRVLVSFLNTSDTFNVGGTDYTFDLLGFSQDDGATISNAFFTIESFGNNAGLYARIRTAAGDEPPPREPPGTSASEPATLALLGLGLAGLAFSRRRQ